MLLKRYHRTDWKEGNMLRLFIAVAVLAYGAHAAAQQTNQKQVPASDGVTVQSGTAGKALSGKAQEGNTGSASGSLMDKRSKAMSPEAASGAKSGQVTQ